MKKLLTLLLILLLPLTVMSESQFEWEVYNANMITKSLKHFIYYGEFADEAPTEMTEENDNMKLVYILDESSETPTELTFFLEKDKSEIMLTFEDTSEHPKTDVFIAFFICASHDFQRLAAVMKLPESRFVYSPTLTLHAVHLGHATLQYDIQKLDNKMYLHTLRLFDTW